MKKALIIGSTAVDVIIRLEEKLPKTGEDVHVRSQEMLLGGCAYNVYDVLRYFDVPAILFSPVGAGVYGDFIDAALRAQKTERVIPRPAEENGCCYCFVEDTGERSFVSYHGAEYRFYPEWFRLIDPAEVDMVYICGLEIEEPTGECIVEFLERNPSLPVYFAPGPRLLRIREDRLTRIFALSPVLHLNEDEALAAGGADTLSEAARTLYSRTGNTVVITRGEKGCSWYDGRMLHHEAAYPVTQLDTIGAGDAHIGALLTFLKRGDTLQEAVKKANLAAAAVVSSPGARGDYARFFSVFGGS